MSVSGNTVERSTLQRVIFAETLRDAPLLPARFVAALARCPTSPGAASAERAKSQRRGHGEFLNRL